METPEFKVIQYIPLDEPLLGVEAMGSDVKFTELTGRIFYHKKTKVQGAEFNCIDSCFVPELDATNYVLMLDPHQYDGIIKKSDRYLFQRLLVGEIAMNEDVYPNSENDEEFLKQVIQYGVLSQLFIEDEISLADQLALLPPRKKPKPKKAKAKKK